jgi:hypothetical protein
MKADCVHSPHYSGADVSCEVRAAIPTVPDDGSFDVVLARPEEAALASAIKAVRMTMLNLIAAAD